MNPISILLAVSSILLFLAGVSWINTGWNRAIKILMYVFAVVNAVAFVQQMGWIFKVA